MQQHCIVLLSTYNGQTFLKEQLDSIADQDFDGLITTLVRDDGSSDDTLSILENYPQTESRRFQIIKGENIRPQRSFLELIRLAPKADYYFFADQDDVWDADKVSTAVKAMGCLEHPVCWCANFRHTYTDLLVYEEKALAQKPPFDPLQIIFYNQIPGCCMGFNWALMELLQAMNLPNVMMHDSYVLALAAACGNVLYDDNARISHRIHESNVVGHGHKKIVLHKWIPEKLKLLFGKENYDLSQMADQFLQVAGDRIHPRYRQDLILLRDFKKCRKCKRKLLRHPHTQGKLFDRTVMSIRCKIRFNIF